MSIEDLIQVYLDYRTLLERVMESEIVTDEHRKKFEKLQLVQKQIEEKEFEEV